MTPGLQDLPVELLYTVQFYALSEALPHISRHFYRVFRSAPPSFHAEYIAGRVLSVSGTQNEIINSALRYPLCTMEVFGVLCRRADITTSLQVELPQRLFRDLPCRGSEWTENDHPLPFVKYLCDRFHIRINHDSYRDALTQATQACFLPLISCLLYNGTPGWQTLQLWAIMGCHEGVVKLLVVQDDIDVNLTDLDGKTPLAWAAFYGWEEVVKLLLVRDDVDVNSKDIDGKTPLSWAAHHGREKVVELLLAQDDIDVNSEDLKGKTPFYWAASFGWEGVVKLLLVRDDVNVNSKDVDGKTPLFWAAYWKRENVVKLLLAQDNIDVNSKELGETPLSLAIYHGWKEVVKLLLMRHDIKA